MEHDFAQLHLSQHLKDGHGIAIDFDLCRIERIDDSFVALRAFGLGAKVREIDTAVSANRGEDVWGRSSYGILCVVERADLPRFPIISESRYRLRKGAIIQDLCKKMLGVLLI